MAELRAEVGDRAVDGLRRALLAFVEREGALDEVRALRLRVTLEIPSVVGGRTGADHYEAHQDGRHPGELQHRRRFGKIRAPRIDRAHGLDRQQQRGQRRRQPRERDGDQQPADHLRGQRESDQPQLALGDARRLEATSPMTTPADIRGEQSRRCGGGPRTAALAGAAKVSFGSPGRSTEMNAAY